MQIHWNYHAWFMGGTWLILVPLIVIYMRFGKEKPNLLGAPMPKSLFERKVMFFVAHFFGGLIAVLLSLAGMAIAMTVSGGFSGSVHSFLGIGTVVLGTMQLVSGLLRGTHGGRYGPNSVPDDPSTWSGDHFDMTSRRRWFEAYHKFVGYTTMAFALGAVATGLAQYWLPNVAIVMASTLVFMVALAVVLQKKGCHHDTYNSVFGFSTDNPYNRERYRL